jgi:FkbM family methyltransferase
VRLNYSQGEEQQHILEHCAEHGRFLDIGAWNAKNLSNTRALYERGWSGVLVEPSPEPFMGLLHEYGNDERVDLILGAVARSAGLERFHASADALTTSSPQNFEKWREVGGFYGRFWVHTFEIGFLVRNFGPFDFVNIDTEGSSVAIFHDLLECAAPKVICVEHDFRNVETLEMAKAKGYREVYFSGENQVFAK